MSNKKNTHNKNNIEIISNSEDKSRISSDILMENFETLAKAKGGIPKLRETILQLAVQGKLVPQNPEDEPASVLLKKIQAEKERLVKEGMIKKQKPLPPVDPEEVPYDLPDGWVWTRFGSVLYSRDHERIPLSRSERENRHGEYDYYGASGVIDDIDDYLFDKPLLLIGEDGANLINRSTPIAFIAKGKYWVNNHAHVLDGYSLEFLEYIELFINSIDLKLYVTGTAQPKMNQAKMNSIIVSLPPLAEQHRIVERVDTLMKLCDELEARQNTESETRRMLLLSSLNCLLDAKDDAGADAARDILKSNFDNLFDDKESIAEMRKAILQLAVQGRLSEQNPDDEPAAVLLEKIQAEKTQLVKEGKIKKQKTLPPVSPEEVPYEIPEGWVWTRLENVSFKIGDLDHKMPQECSEGIPYISPRDFTTNNGINFNNSKKISFEDYEKLRQKIEPEKTDIIFPRYGTIGENRFVESDQKFLVSYSCALVKPFKTQISPKYIFNYSLSPLIKSEIERYINKTTQPNVGIKSIKNFIIPLPPLAEQHRIVERVDTLMKLCDELEERVLAKENAAERLLFSVCDGICG